MNIYGVVNLIVTALFLVRGSCSDLCKFDVRIKQTLLNEGFHRNLTYGIVLDRNGEDAGLTREWWYSNCLVGLEQALPAGLYVNPDELGDLRRIGKVSAFPRSRVDVEQPAERSSPSFVYVVGKVNRQHAALWVPLHARYLQPRQQGGTALNIILPPKFYIRCPDERLNQCDFRPPPELPFLCNGNSQKCEWKEIPYTMLTSEVRWEVPVGNRSHLTAVLLGTGLVVVLGSVYLLCVLHQYNRRHAKKNN